MYTGERETVYVESIVERSGRTDVRDLGGRSEGQQLSQVAWSVTYEDRLAFGGIAAEGSSSQQLADYAQSAINTLCAFIFTTHIHTAIILWRSQYDFLLEFNRNYVSFFIYLVI